MTQTDLLTLTAVRTSTPFRRNGRTVVPLQDGSVRVDLFGAPLLTVNAQRTAIDLDGSALPTRKSSRTSNVILSAFTTCRVLTREGRWFIQTPDKELIPFTGMTGSVPTM